MEGLHIQRSRVRIITTDTSWAGIANGGLQEGDANTKNNSVGTESVVEYLSQACSMLQEGAKANSNSSTEKIFPHGSRTKVVEEGFSCEILNCVVFHHTTY